MTDAASRTGSGPATRTLEGEPGGVGTLARAALPMLPVVGALPGVRKQPAETFEGLRYERTGVRVDRADVDAYARVCGFPAKDVAPLPYVHMLAFPLHMAIMTDREFPYPAIGTLHVENSITQHRPIAIGETLAVTTSVAPARPHAKGKVLDFVTSAVSTGPDGTGDEVVWESTSTYLRRGKGDRDAPAGLELEDVPASGIRWKLPADLGRRYAAVSGDHNPIHLYPWTAKALGFPRQIAHGMWSKARCVAALENRIPDAARVDVAFKKPILLPGSVAFGARATDDGYAFSLASPTSGAPHLRGRVVPA